MLLQVKFFNLLKISKVQKLFGIIFLLFFYALLYKILIPRLTAFGCFDDCFNFLGGYFLLHNKKLFSEIFYNHAPLMAYLSMFIQSVTHPSNLYELILRHRQFVLIFGLISEILLLLRFGLIILPFSLIYELTKFYLFGDRFLAEGLIIYPLVYMLGAYLEQAFVKTKNKLDAISASFCAWFVIFAREPYTFTAIFLFALLLFGIKNKKFVLISLGIFTVLSLLTIFYHNLNEFIFNVITINFFSVASENAQTHILSFDIYKSFLYPFLLIFQNSFSFFGKMELAFALVFVLLSGFFIAKKKYFFAVILWLILGLTNLRLIDSGTEYFGAFHLLPWYGLFLFSIIFLLFKIFKTSKFVSLFLMLITAVAFLTIFTKGSYIFDHVNEHTEFITNYGIPMQVGNVVNALSKPTDTLFLDKPDDIIYFVAHRYSSYKYSWYTSFMPQIKKYQDARITMFQKSPPDFYYGSCPKEKNQNYILPNFVKDDYQELFNLSDPSCLWIKKSKLSEITDSMWQKAGEQLYYLQPKTN